MKKPKAKSESIFHYESILLENMRSEFRAVAEQVDGVRETLEGKIEASEKRIKEELRKQAQIQ